MPFPNQHIKIAQILLHLKVQVQSLQDKSFVMDKINLYESLGTMQDLPFT